MPRGGKRPGAGRPKGSKNKRTKELRERLKGANALPELVLAEVAMNEVEDTKLRIDAAKALMPYLWPKLSSVDMDIEAEVGGGFKLMIKERGDGDSEDD